MKKQTCESHRSRYDVNRFLGRWKEQGYEMKSREDRKGGGNYERCTRRQKVVKWNIACSITSDMDNRGCDLICSAAWKESMEDRRLDKRVLGLFIDLLNRVFRKSSMQRRIERVGHYTDVLIDSKQLSIWSVLCSNPQSPSRSHTGTSADSNNDLDKTITRN